ncbi:MAG: type II toxin-antitoxin system Phd/YefM family antitoxin [Firmicutes bacterium]|nr:type II toxin-antitoxin system Phd/YefM family antitoxin [Bacillota bacterium]
MPIIRPTSDLRNNFSELSELVHKEAQPVFITKNGRDDMVLMSMALYEQQQAVLELYRKLLEAEVEVQSGARLIPFAEAMAKLKGGPDA